MGIFRKLRRDLVEGPLAALAVARGRQLLLELLQTADQGVALGGERRDLALPERGALVLLCDPRLEVRLSLVEVLQLGLETGDALPGRQVADEEHVENEQDQDEARRDEEPGGSRVGPVRHGLGF